MRLSMHRTYLLISWLAQLTRKWFKIKRKWCEGFTELYEIAKRCIV